MFRRLILLNVILFNVSFNFAQKEVQPEIGFSGSAAAMGYYMARHYDFSSGVIDRRIAKSENGYIGFNARIGARIQMNNKSLLFAGQYQWISTQDDYRRKEIFTSNLLGISSEFRFFEKSKVRLFINAQILSEVYSSYKRNYLQENSYRPISKYPFSPFTNQTTQSFRTNVYQGTPFIGNVLIGCNAKIVDQLSVNISAGYGVRVLKSQEASLKYVESVSLTEPVSTKLIGRPHHLAFHMLNIELGLNYAFSLQKKSKITMP